MPDFPEVDAVTRRIVSPAVLAALKAQLEEAGLSGGGEVEQVTLTDNLAYTLPSTVWPTRKHSVVFTQDATGGRTVTHNGTPVAVDPLPGAVTIVEIWPGAGVTLPGPLAGEISSALDTALAYANSASGSATAASGYAVEAEGHKDAVALLAANVDAKVLSGSGKPVGVVTPSAVGQLYVDTAVTAGVRLWVSTGLTAGYWVVAVGDTGWRDVTSAWAPLFTDAGGVVTFNAYPAIKARRVGALVEVYVQGLVKSLAGNATMQAGMPVGWRAVQSFDHLSADSSLSIIRWVVSAGSSPATCGGPVGGARSLRLAWTTSDDWPSVLP